MKKTIIAVLLAAIILIGTTYFVYMNLGEILYDNSTPARELITETNSSAKFETWLIRCQNGGNHATLWEMLLTFKVECIRKTPQGYYVVMYLDNGSTSYTFFGSNLEVSLEKENDLIAGDFLSLSEMEAALAALEVDGVLTQDAVWESELVNRFIGTWLKRTLVAPVQEGAVILKFQGYGSNEGELKSMEFLPETQWYDTCDAEIPGNGEMPPMAVLFPYILEIDRMAR